MKLSLDNTYRLCCYRLKLMLFVLLQLVSGFVSYSYANNLGAQTFVFDSVPVDDGQWHYFEVRWPDNGDFIMILDYGQRQVKITVCLLMLTLERVVT